MPTLEFWYDFASTYSYLTARRLGEAATGVAIMYRPFLLGPIFKAQGWTTSPFQLYPAKGSYMVRDIARISADRGIPFHMPEQFPVNSLHAARIALVGDAEGWIAGFTRAVFDAQFAERRDISNEGVLSEILSRLGLDSGSILEKSKAPEIKSRLREQTEQAAQRGIFGAPSFVTGAGEVFWGDDRLEQALTWARRI